MQAPPEDRSRVWDVTMIVLLLGSVALVYVYEALDPGRYASTRQALLYIDLALVAFFVIEWVWRVVSKERSGRYAMRQSWELLGMVPLLVPVPAGLRALRLLRIVRILRVFKTIGRKLGVWQRIAQQGHLKPIALASGGVTFLGAVLVWLLERRIDGAPLASFTEAVWWAIVTVTTVGYGDVTPVTGGGRFIAAGLMVVGIGIIGLLASTLASALLEGREEADAAESEAAAGGTGPHLVRDLEALSQMWQAGHLDDDEYRAAKRRILPEAAAP